MILKKYHNNGTVTEETFNEKCTGAVSHKVLIVKYHGPTNFKGSRISITDSWTGTRKYFSYDGSISNSIAAQAEYRLHLLGHKIDGYSCNDKTGEYYLFWKWNKDNILDITEMN